ncbi:60S ribosomal protein L4 [Heterostelium album PN500]|uniref:60S ribosomal protein L4 n=1 Tax=Heterostelium pallidum (strain ATCC 26659 / Pp 5 / PN500) TaxID=670386 RepID=D3BJC7_HETP5|nr:60S ribosomal protein L4 [Heterostelium album PN500]EFA78007.1 60S ribosomal protein L4 [Heterostelium album PN500]|eukprot:XP_020430135.1 60S ribosomal protein L4 [Heterostelium album PN500]
MSARPFVQVYNGENAVSGKVKLPAVLTTPIRPDLVNFVHTNVNKNHRQAYAPSSHAGEQTSAESWGTGRAVARIPRVAGSGTHRSGQGAFGNMCRGGRMYGPNKVWRKWNRKVNVNHKRYAVASALAASAIPALVMARGHQISQIAEVPLVVANSVIDSLTKTNAAVALLKKLNAFADVQRCDDSKHLRAGAGKSRNRRYTIRRGPLIVCSGKSQLSHAFRNLPGVDVANVSRLNLLKLAPGGHLGRFVIWTQSAFEQLDSIFGTYSKKSANKSGFRLPRPVLQNADVQRLIGSDEVQTAIKESQHSVTAPRGTIVRRNPLKNLKAMLKLNPAAVHSRRSNGKKVTKKAHKKSVTPLRKAFIKQTFA